MLDLFADFFNDISGKLIDIVIALRTGEFGERIDQVAGMIDFVKAAPAGNALLAIIPAGGFTHAGFKGAHLGLPFVSYTKLIGLLKNDKGLPPLVTFF